MQITDFGLAKAASQATLSSTGMLLGTAAYLAPEMIENNLATPQGDCYSVGIMAWEMLTGQVPFLADNPVTMVFKHVNENVPSVATVCTGIDPQVARFISYRRPASRQWVLSEPCHPLAAPLWRSVPAHPGRSGIAGPGGYYEMPQIEALHCQENAPCKIAGVPWTDYEKALKAAGIAYETSKSYSDTA